MAYYWNAKHVIICHDANPQAFSLFLQTSHYDGHTGQTHRTHRICALSWPQTWFSSKWISLWSWVFKSDVAMVLHVFIAMAIPFSDITFNPVVCQIKTGQEALVEEFGIGDLYCTALESFGSFGAYWLGSLSSFPTWSLAEAHRLPSAPADHLQTSSNVADDRLGWLERVWAMVHACIRFLWKLTGGLFDRLLRVLGFYRDIRDICLVKKRHQPKPKKPDSFGKNTCFFSQLLGYQALHGRKNPWPPRRPRKRMRSYGLPRGQRNQAETAEALQAVQTTPRKNLLHVSAENLLSKKPFEHWINVFLKKSIFANEIH